PITGADLPLTGEQRRRHQVRREGAGVVRLPREQVLPQLPADADVEVSAPRALAVADRRQHLQPARARRQLLLGRGSSPLGDPEASQPLQTMLGGGAIPGGVVLQGIAAEVGRPAVADEEAAAPLDRGAAPEALTGQAVDLVEQTARRLVDVLAESR